jgi:hypothetical protein
MRSEVFKMTTNSKPREFFLCDETDNSGWSCRPWSEKEAKRQYGSCNVILVREVTTESEAEIAELKQFVSDIAVLFSGIRIAVDYLVTREPDARVHQININYFKSLDTKLSELDNKIFKFGNFVKGKFVFMNEAMQSEGE